MRPGARAALAGGLAGLALAGALFARTLVEKPARCTVVLTIQIEIFGERATDELARRWKQEIESEWNGPTVEMIEALAGEFGLDPKKDHQELDELGRDLLEEMGVPEGYTRVNCCNVRVVADIRVGQGTDRFHQVEAVPEYEQAEIRGRMVPVRFRDFVLGAPYAFRGDASGRWGDAREGHSAAAHEAGHLLGLGDEYVDVVLRRQDGSVFIDPKTGGPVVFGSRPKEGHELDVMSDNDHGWPMTGGFDEIFRRAGVTCDCCPRTAVDAKALDWVDGNIDRIEGHLDDALENCWETVLGSMDGYTDDLLRELEGVDGLDELGAGARRLRIKKMKERARRKLEECRKSRTARCEPRRGSGGEMRREVAWRPSDGGGTLRVAASGGEVACADTIRFAGETGWVASSTVSYLEPGWTWDASTATAAGPPLADVRVALDLPPGAAPPSSTDLLCEHSGSVVGAGEVPVTQQPPLAGPATALDVTAPPLGVVGDPIRMTVAGEWPADASWWLSSETGGLALTSPLRATTVDGGVRLAGRLPSDGATGTNPVLEARDSWGDLLARDEVACRAVTDSRPAGTLESVSPFVEAGGALCACGRFDAASAGSGWTLGGKALGEPLAASGRTLLFAVPVDLPPGEHAVSAQELAGGAARGSAATRLVEVRAALDAEELWRGGRTTLRIEVVGSDAPFGFELTNRSPGVVRLARGDRQSATTSGGRRNRYEEVVLAVEKGEFLIDWSLPLGGCPCAAASTP